MFECKWLRSWPIMLILKSHAFTRLPMLSNFKLCAIVANMKCLPEPKLYQKPIDDHKDYKTSSQVTLQLSSNLIDTYLDCNNIQEL